MASVRALVDHQLDEARSRVSESTDARRRNATTLAEPGGMARADEPERVATRIDRLARFFPDVRPVSPLALAEADPSAMNAAGVILERVINTEDFLRAAYLEGGALAQRAVGRVHIQDARGKLGGYGTGFLVTPRLLLTNHHVLSDRGVAAASSIEFDYQDSLDGGTRPPIAFDFDAERFFLADEALDFALVAVKATPEQLQQFGFNPLIAAEGKAIVGDFVSIIQHPSGSRKQVALRENRLLVVLDRHLHYTTDTQPGSSGSPVFNDQWEVVALHHASVRDTERPELGGYVNEGVRVSRLLEFVASRPYDAQQQILVDELLGRAATPIVVAPPSPAAGGGAGASGGEHVAPAASTPAGPLQVTGALEVTLRPAPRPADDHAFEAVTIDPDYANRQGYDAAFIGAGELEVALPRLPEDLLALAATNTQATTEARHVLDYHHYSVVMNKERRLAFFTAVNIDGATSFREELRRESDRWFFDPRLPETEQTGEEVYENNPLDRGHLVRRLDPGWGADLAEAKTAADDTFHFTNCTPQHAQFNQNRTTWAGLEDYILLNADNLDFKASVLTGPVLADDDEEYRGVQLPRQYWKVVAMVKQDGSLSATAYLLSQAQLLTDLELAPEEFSYGAYKTFQVPISKVEEMTRLDLGSLKAADPLAQEENEATVALREIRRPAQLVL